VGIPFGIPRHGGGQQDVDRVRELMRVGRALAGEPMPPSVQQDRHAGTTVMHVYDEAGLYALAQALAAGESLIGLDIETTAVEPEDGLIRLVQLARGNLAGVIDCFYVDPRPLLITLAGRA
jgi:hypothetical protein